MKQTNTKKITTLLSLVALIVLLASCKEDPKKIQFPDGLPTMSLKDSLQFDPDWYKAEYKVVTYIRGSRNLYPLWLDWESYINEFPEMAFIFYFTSKDTASLFEELEKNNFYHPFILDQENIFFTVNEYENTEFTSGNKKLKQNNFIPIIVKGDTLKEVAEVGMPSLFRRDMRELLNKIQVIRCPGAAV